MRKLWSKPRCGCWVIIVLALVACYMSIGFSINFPPKSPLQRLEEARALWEAKGSDSYAMIIRLASHAITARYQIVVRNNQVADVSTYYPLTLQLTPTPLAPEDKMPTKSDMRFTRMLFPTFAEFTMDNLFKNAMKELEFASAPPIVDFCDVHTPLTPHLTRITYDQQLGYIQNMDLGDCPKWDFGGGFLLCPVSHCHANVDIVSLEPLPPD